MTAGTDIICCSCILWNHRILQYPLYPFVPKRYRMEEKMKERNVYRNIVLFAVLWMSISSLWKWIETWQKEQKTYEFAIQSDSDLTQNTLEQFQNISGLCLFDSVDTVRVTVKLKEYEMETELYGCNLEEYPLKWQKSDGEILLNNTLSLFFGADSFQLLRDKNEFYPDKGQIRKWIENYQDLTLIVVDEKGKERKAKICGILKEPGNNIYMDKGQMEEIYQDDARALGGYVRIYGYQNMKKAKKMLENAGFMVTDLPSLK